ncbi:MAG: iron-siderophore ABC transporter substrate-binding protein [Halanaerobiales bacterium]|nr:iron-siderophore ABC transporter substrate-binding protein [Halanaerobiales bacterium]
MISFNKKSFKNINILILSILFLSLAFFSSPIQAEDTRVIEHAMGTTEIKGTPQRIVVLYQGATDSILAFDKKPVGAVESWIQKPWYKYIREEMDGVTNVGSETQPNLEKIVELDPDLIIGSKLRHEKIYNKLSAIAPTVMSETVYEWKKTVNLIGKAINEEEKAQTIIKDWNQRANQFKEKVGKKIDSEVSIVRFMTDHARIYYTGFAGSILQDVGLKRPENQRKDKWGIKLTSKESIPNMDGDVIFDITDDYSGDEASFETRDEWQNHPLWNNLKAVKKGNVYKVDSVIWNMGGGAIAADKLLDDLYKYFDIN